MNKSKNIENIKNGKKNINNFLLYFEYNRVPKIRAMSENEMQPKVIIRTSIGSKIPLDGGVQHKQDYTKVFKSILTEINVVELKSSNSIFKEFYKAYNRKDGKSSLIIEHGDHYNKK